MDITINTLFPFPNVTTAQSLLLLVIYVILLILLLTYSATLPLLKIILYFSNLLYREALIKPLQGGFWIANIL